MSTIRRQSLVLASAACLTLAGWSAHPAWSRSGTGPLPPERGIPTEAETEAHGLDRPIRGRAARLPPPSGVTVEPEGEEVHRHDEPKPPEPGATAQPLEPAGDEATAALATKALAPGAGFDGIDGVASGTLPPDPTGAVSPPLGASGAQFVVETVNEGLQVFDLAGNPATAFVPFWNPATGFFSRDPAHHDVIFDPRVVFDPYAQRFFLVALENGKDNKGYIHVAVSASADPRGAWSTFKTLVPVNPQVYFPDYTSLGFDRQALYIGVNLFTGAPAAPPNGLLYRAVGKASMLNNSNPLLTVLVDRLETNLPAQYPWSMRAAQLLDLPFGSAAEGLFLGTFRDALNPATTFQKLRVVKMRQPLDAAQASLATFDLAVPGYREPAVDAPQGATDCGTTPGPVDVSSGQLQNAVWRQDDLYAAQTVRRAVGATVSNAARWYRIRTGPPTAPVGWAQLVESGDILADTTGAKHTYLPTVGVDAKRSLLVAYAQSSGGEPVSFRVAARAACAGDGVLQSFLIIKSVDHCYEQGGPPHRWGDFWALAIDPASPTRLWAVGEYVKTKNVWGTWVEPIELLPDCPLCSCYSGL